MTIPVTPSAFTMATTFKGMSVPNAYFIISKYATADRPEYIIYEVNVFANKELSTDPTAVLEVRKFTKELNPKEPGNVYQQFFKWIVTQPDYKNAVVE